MHHAPLAKVTAPSQSAKQQLLVCFSHLRWNFVYQRPQHLLTRAARNHHVYFVEEPMFERGGTLPRLDLRPQPSGVMVAVPVLAEGSSEAEIVEAQRQLVDDLLAGRAEEHRTFWYYTPMAMAFTEHLEPDLCIYDCMDELSAFRFAPPALRALEAKLLARADLVFTGGQSLYEAKRGRHPNIHAFPSSIDTAHFAKARRTGGRGPDDQAALPRPRLGFFGVIDERMDLDLVGRLAELRPDWQLVMVGPVVKIDPATLPRRPNVHWLGGKTYDELPAYLAGWDLGFMPFALNESTRYISPTKTPEFLAAGIPVISTPITDVVRPYGDMGLVEIARDAGELARKAELLLSRPKSAWLERVDAHLSGMSWDKTWAAMQALMRRARSDAALPDPAPAVASKTLREGALRV